VAQKKILALVPYASEFMDVYQAIQSASMKSEENTNQSYILSRPDKSSSGYITDRLLEEIKLCDLAIVDTTQANPNVLYMLGIAEALNKPVILINQMDYQVPFDIAQKRFLLYHRNKLHNELVPHLMDAITVGIKNPEEFIFSESKPKKESKKPTVFVSYSHVDAEYLKRFSVHVKPLERKGLVDIWVDTKIKAGDKWQDEIEQALSKSAIAILFISADFLASDFIVDNELPPLLEAAENKGTRILPIIIKPCRFSREPHLSKFQALNSPDNPILLMPEIEREVLWDKLSYEIEVEIENRA